MAFTSGTWRNGKRTLTGRWEYQRASERFIIHLDSRDRVTGQNRSVIACGDSPEWGNWKLVRVGGKL